MHSPSTTPQTLPHQARWLKAALVGSIWASVEIVLGSFLHNIRFPVTGTVLASIGVSLLVASRLVWKENGIIWRAGVICAVLKSISPSAVILGPMLGIMSEAFLLEIAIRLLGGNAAGFVVGGALAVLSPLLQKVVSLLVTYGFNIAELYVRMYEFAARSLSIESFGPVDLLFVLVGLSVVFGAFAGTMGMILGRKALGIQPAELSDERGTAPMTIDTGSREQRYSRALLVAHVAALAGGLFLISQSHLWISSIYVLAYVLGTLMVYPHASKRLRKPRLWIEFAAISLLAGFLLGGLTNDQPGWQLEGLSVGFQMTLRGILVIVGFSAIGVELRNPVILNWFLNRGLGQLSASVEVAFEALPLMMNAFANQKRLLLSPLRSLSSVLAAGKLWLEQNKLSQRSGPDVFILTGAPATGKTTLLAGVVSGLQDAGIRVGGFMARGIWKSGTRLGFDLVTVRDETVRPLCRTDIEPTGIQTGPFRFLSETIDHGRAVLLDDMHSMFEVLVVDEVGPLELGGNGWDQALKRLSREYKGVLVLLVRPQLVPDVSERWNFSPVAVWNVGAIDSSSIVASIKSHLRSAGHQQAGRTTMTASRS